MRSRTSSAEAHAQLRPGVHVRDGDGADERVGHGDERPVERSVDHQHGQVLAPRRDDRGGHDDSAANDTI